MAAHGVHSASHTVTSSCSIGAIRSSPVQERTTRRLIDRFNLTVPPAVPVFGAGEI